MTQTLALQSSDVARLLALQSALVAAAAVAALALVGTSGAVAAIYGGAGALLSTWLLGRRVRRAADVARSEPGRETAVLYIGAVQRFVIVFALFAVGMGQLGLAPVPLLVGFGVAQAGFLLGGARPAPPPTRSSTMEKWG